MSNTKLHTASTLRPAILSAFDAGSSLLGSYLDNMGAFDYAVLVVLWQDHGAGDDSILSFAEKIRKA